MFQHDYDHPAVPGNKDREHDPLVEQYECVACHDGAHAQYEQDVNEVTDGTVKHDDGEPRQVLINDAYHGPTRFLLVWHGRNGYCPLHAE